jgi:malonate decarboxylase beta subunit
VEKANSWYEASARQRVRALVDADTFVEFIGPEDREVSPHLGLFDLPVQFDDGMMVGSARLEGRPILIAAQEGRFMGGSFGEVHGAKLTGLLRGAKTIERDVLVLLDTGGVRLQEANAGETAIAEIMRALLEARRVGVQVIGLIGGRAGCYGGGSLIAACCSTLIVSEQARIGVSGPEVIETNRGVEEFDATDRALVWRTMGGKHRYLLGAADIHVADSVAEFRRAALVALRERTVLALETLQREQTRLEQRLERFGGCADARDIWSELGVAEPTQIPELASDEFDVIAAAFRVNSHDAR